MNAKKFSPPDVDALKQTLAVVNAEDGIESVIAHLEERFPWDFRAACLSKEGYVPNVALYRSDGELITTNIEGWIKDQIQEHDSLSKFFNYWQAQNLVRSKEQHIHYLITSQISPDQTDLLIYRVSFVQEVPYKKFGTGFFSQTDLEDLLDGYSEADAEGEPYGAKRLEVDRIDYLPALIDQEYKNEMKRRQHFVDTNEITTIDGSTGHKETKSILEAYPGYLDYKLPIQRFLDDWQALCGTNRLAEKFNFEIKRYRDRDSEEWQYAFYPRPADLQDIPRFEDTDDVKKILENCEAIDAAAGYDHAWFFHAVYGNRIDSGVIRTLGDHLELGKIYMNPDLIAVIKDWTEEPYSF